MPYHLIHDDISRDTVTALEQLLDGARSGQVTGLVFGAMLKRRRYLVNIAGDAVRDPTFARGMAGAIVDELRTLIHKRSQSDTTV